MDLPLPHGRNWVAAASKDEQVAQARIDPTESASRLFAATSRQTQGLLSGTVPSP